MRGRQFCERLVFQGVLFSLLSCFLKKNENLAKRDELVGNFFFYFHHRVANCAVCCFFFFFTNFLNFLNFFSRASVECDESRATFSLISIFFKKNKKNTKNNSFLLVHCEPPFFVARIFIEFASYFIARVSVFVVTAFSEPLATPAVKYKRKQNTVCKTRFLYKKKKKEKSTMIYWLGDEAHGTGVESFCLGLNRRPIHCAGWPFNFSIVFSISPRDLCFSLVFPVLAARLRFASDTRATGPFGYPLDVTSRAGHARPVNYHAHRNTDPQGTSHTQTMKKAHTPHRLARFEFPARHLLKRVFISRAALSQPGPECEARWRAFSASRLVY